MGFLFCNLHKYYQSLYIKLLNTNSIVHYIAGFHPCISNNSLDNFVVKNSGLKNFPSRFHIHCNLGFFIHNQSNINFTNRSKIQVNIYVKYIIRIDSQLIIKSWRLVLVKN